MAFAGGRKPTIFHSDQGSHFTSSDCLERLLADKIKISWSGGWRCFDNILVERLWRTVKYSAEGFSPQASRGVFVGLQRCLGVELSQIFLQVTPW
jgi:transposase InsO family protein